MIFSGVINQTFFIALDDQGTDEDLIAGTEIGREDYYWAGAQYDLVFVQDDTRLQIQREMRGEFDTNVYRKVQKTFILPSNTQVTVTNVR